MKRFVVMFLFAAFSLVQAAPAAEDAHTIFQRMWDANQLHKGMNLILTYPDKQKLWANIKAEKGYAVVVWVLTDAAGKVIPTQLARGRAPGVMMEQQDCFECTKSPTGDPSKDPHCKKVPCPKRVPCCPNKHWCC